ncbi:carbohydrate kinase family protein [Methylocystis sp. MJC1]|uniref:carbohydrate kinase family protein n=1 Tax=Methylocystis sp. MJC1 TaxID=2654282 RepID=UPI0013ECCDA8|nr:carbohydrate kinase family protein [Methylocystis sp. MJC1]KAF2992398.1 Sulfofructose kinase [Methylocystis sp. MJC1]MBU6527534.1 carbohydrate kinase family protein [Methylocystis sp. MJC1]UZX10475.1 carbohydrate kinase family protein [Methylocystis sp. MJC1]
MRGCVCCLGSINVDVTLRLDRLPDQHEKIMAKETAVGGGGSAANTAVWIARQGVSVRMLGWVGDDPLGALALRELQLNGVDTQGVKALAAPSPLAICLATPQDKRIITSPIIDAPWTPYDIGELGPDVDWLHTTVCDAAFLRQARRAGGRPILSLELDGRYDPAFAFAADYLFTNCDELARVVDTSDPIHFLAERHGDGHAIWFVTRGEEGATVIGGGQVETVNATPVEAIDRTGGGDAFNAGVIAALLSGADPQSAAAAGLRLAAQAISRLGAR